MAETWIDTRNGELLVGRAAASERIDEAGPDVVPLADLLMAEEFPFENGEFGKGYVRGWEREDYINCGKWVMNVMASAETVSDSRSTLETKYLERLHILRLCPDVSLFKRNVAPLGEYRQIIGAEATPSDRKYQDWIFADYLAYAKELAQSLGRAPKEADYDAAGGPNGLLVRRRVGGLRGLNEMLGYPDVRQMDENDYIDWGIRVFEANFPRPLSASVIAALSRRDQGPSLYSIQGKFGGKFSIFQELVYEKYDQHVKERAEAKKEKLEEYAQIKKAGRLPEAACELSEDEIVSFIARYWVVRKCLPQQQRATHFRFALYPGSLVYIVRNKYPEVPAADLETMALRLDVFDDIWPLDINSNLRVTDEELKRRRRAERI